MCVDTTFTNVFGTDTATNTGEEISCEQECGNTKVKVAVAVKKDGMAVGNLPRKISCA